MPNCNHCKIINHYNPCDLLCCNKEHEINMDCICACNKPCCQCNKPCSPCNKPCINGALPLLTKCGLIAKKQKQHNIVHINSCNCKPKKCNKKYSFNDQLLILKSHAFKRNDCCRC